MIQRIEPGNRMSEASLHGGIVYLAGQVPETADAGIETQFVGECSHLSVRTGDADNPCAHDLRDLTRH